MIYTKKSSLKSQITSDGLILLDIETGKIHHLNPIASQIWDNIEKTDARLLDLITESYDIDRITAEADIKTTIDELLRQELICYS